jgi:UDP-GlcNAc:undecaprenyl-phosphate/decaprenyl-phosphate GlcNAc-1-phosphate transferase
MLEKFLGTTLALTFAAYLIGRLIIYLAVQKGWVNKVNFRRKSGVQVALLGGLAVYVPLTIYGLAFDAAIFAKPLLCAVPLILCGVMDDIRELRARTKFFAQLLSVGSFLSLTVTADLTLTRVGLPPLVAYGLTAIWMIGIINAVNMIDGMDGEAGGFAVFAALSLWLAIGTAEATQMLLPFAACALGFLLLNRPPAKIYLGDSGSTFIGFFLSAAAAGGVGMPSASLQSALVLIPLFIFAFPEVDAILAMIRRRKGRSSLFSGDHDHIHHKLLKIGFRIDQALAIILGVTFLCGLTAFTIGRTTDPFLMLNVCIISIAGLLGILGFIHYTEFRQGHQVSTYSRSIVMNHLPISTTAALDAQNFRATIYDLLPYYKELKESGIFTVQNFIADFGQLLKTTHGPQTVFLMWGSYSIVALETPRLSSAKDNNLIIRDYFALLEKHKVMKNDNGMPWGLAIFADNSRGQEFLRQFSAFQKEAGPISYSQAA